ncbi:class I SAM-dependent methyltransferase [Halolamina litorea]|uniref:Class I SAM-dependent methyltransferase n=1 Tax=Halolamina litorea TaxID=1515593 RepID=A0ABD6BUZ4_9EURY|nr:class I SAM-dependent methyltransferase [Halolamina litorea]
MSVPLTSRPVSHVYDAAYTGVPNWDIGRPQAAFLALAESGRIRGPVLDVGCGTGELALFLARRGHEVLGIDLSRRAIEQARAKARGRRIDADFAVWDALDLGGLARAGFSFPTVVDSAMFHVLGDAERDRFVDGLAQIVPPGGHYYVLGDARRVDGDVYGISPEELRRRFTGREWEIEFSIPTAFERRWSQNPAYLVGVRRR